MNEPATAPSSGALEALVTVHLAVFLVGVSWAFGGNADWVRTPISLWGSLGILITAAALFSESRDAGAARWAWPVLALNAMVLGSCLTPGFLPVTREGGAFLIPVHVDWWVPSTALPATTIRALWLFDGIYFSCLNIPLALRRRRTIRILLGVAVANALALSIFGTIQKLVGSDGIYFGLVKSPQVHFFASFVYDNHWGAYVILMAGACAGLILRYAFGRRGEGFFRGPALVGLVAATLLCLSVPLSGSRACTLLLCVLVALALVRGVPRIAHALRLSGVSTAATTAAMAAAAILAVAGIWAVAGDVIDARASMTKQQVAAIWAKGAIGSRSILYHDTLRMAHDRPLFGWGMGSYPMVFTPLYNSQESKLDRLPVIYHDAHSDWLQSLAEIGLVGTALIGAAVLLPAVSVRRIRPSPVPYFLVLGCLLTAAYAWVEFPFGNVAVVLAWWLCFFSAVHYMRLTALAEGREAPQ